MLSELCRRCGKEFQTLNPYSAICPACRPADLAEYPAEMGETCGGCGVLKHADDVTICDECGKPVCATCPATCPHTAQAVRG